MRLLLAWLLVLPLVLIGCGGGGGSTGPAPVVSITSQPVEQTVVDGHPVEFAVSARNATAYQWQVNLGGQWADVAGATQPGYRIATTTMAMDGQQYRVVVSGREGQIISSTVTLSVTALVIAPSVTVAPVSVAVFEGEEVAFDVTAAGTTLSYQWQQSGDGTAWTDIADANAARLHFQEVDTGQDGLQFRVRVSNTAGEVTSAVATLQVNPVPVAPSITSQPVGATVTEGQTATFTAVAVGTPVPDLQWQTSVDGGSTWSNVAGATGSAYTTAATLLSQNGQRFRVVASNASGIVESDAALLTVGPVPVAARMTSQPQNATVPAGQAVTFTAAASGTPQPTLQWQFSNDGVKWANINGATAATYTLASTSGADNGRLFRLVATNGTGVAVSQPAAVSIGAAAGGSPSLSLLFGDLGGWGNLDGVGAAARLSEVSGLAFDRSGNLIVSDGFGPVVRRMSPDGTLSTWVGRYGQWDASVDGAGAAARFGTVDGAAVDSANNVYVTDQVNDTVRKISPQGVVTTVAEVMGARAVAVDGAGNLYVCGWTAITRVAADGTASLLAGDFWQDGYIDATGADARFRGLEDIVLASNGDLLVADGSGRTVRRVTQAGVVTTVAGTQDVDGSADGPVGTALFYQPMALAIDDVGNIYVADNANSNIRMISTGGMVHTVAGVTGSSGTEDGDVSVARFSTLKAIAVAANGDLYVGDGERIRKISGNTVSTVAGKAKYNGYDITGVVADSLGNVYLGDRLVKVIRRIAPDGTATPFAYADSPAGLAIDAAGNVYVANSDNHTIDVITPAGVSRTFAGSPGEAGSDDGVGGLARFQQPNSLAVDSSGNVYVTDFGNHAIRKIRPDGTVSTFSGVAGQSGYANGPASSARYSRPSQVAVDGNGDVFVTDHSGAIRRLDATGRATALAGVAEADTPLDGVGVDARFGAGAVLAVHNGLLHVVDSGTVRTVDSSGKVTTIAGVVGQIGVRLGTDARLGWVAAMAPLDANRLVISVFGEQSVVVLTK